MEVKINLREREVAEAIQLYLALKGYNALRYRFHTSAEYSRVFFDRQLTSRFDSARFTCEEASFSDKFLLEQIKAVTGRDLRGVIK